MESTVPDLKAEVGNDALVLAICEAAAPSVNGPAAHRLAQALSSVGVSDTAWLKQLLDEVDPARVQHWSDEIQRLQADDTEVITAASSRYPTNLALTFNAPPVLFVRGSLLPSDRRSIAVVGTRSATPRGVKLAHHIAKQLALRNVTIVSGLAKGIDTAAHAGALAAGGRTISVFGTTIDKVYPAANRSLARLVQQSGACISQFLPGRNVGRWGFPVRNVTMSGLSLGTIVVEASDTSGAKLQAEAALAHGKHLFLVEELVTSQDWALEMAKEPSVTVSSDPDEILEAAELLVSPLGGVLI